MGERSRARRDAAADGLAHGQPSPRLYPALQVLPAVAAPLRRLAGQPCAHRDAEGGVGPWRAVAGANAQPAGRAALTDEVEQRLAVYGSLAPGEKHHDQVTGLIGTWERGTVAG